MRRTLPLLPILAGFLLAACHTAPVFKSPYGAPPPGTPPLVTTVADVAALLETRSPVHPLFWAHTDVTLEPAEGRKARFSATIIHRDPDGIRIRGSHMLAGLLFELVIDGPRALVYLRDGKELYEGETASLQEQGGILAAIPPTDLIGALLANQLLARELREGGKWKALEERDHLFLIHTRADGFTRIWRIRRSDGLIRDVVLRDPHGKTALNIRYDEWTLVDDGEPLPSDLILTLEDGILRMRLEVDDYKTMPPIDPAVVTREPRPVDTRLPLSALQRRASVIPEDS